MIFDVYLWIVVSVLVVAVLALGVLVFLLRRRIARVEGMIPPEYATYEDPNMRRPQDDDIEDAMTYFAVPGQGLDEGGDES